MNETRRQDSGQPDPPATRNPDQPRAACTWPRFAREVIECAVRGGNPARVPPPPGPDPASHGIFVTLHRLGRLRGCIGSIAPADSLAQAVRTAACGAALEDPRFPRVTAAELPEIHISVSLLTEPRPLRTLDELELGRHGIIVRRAGHRGVFLPQVATEHHMDREEFLSRCCADKAGLPPDAWRSPTTEVYLFETVVESE